jgi:hypothetical protein
MEENSSALPTARRRKELPEKLIVGYCNWGQADDAVIEAVRDGVNVLIWFSIDLTVDETTGNPSIGGRHMPPLHAVATIAQRMREEGLECLHLLSIGGWNSPHPTTIHSADEMFHTLDTWNRDQCSRPEQGFDGFDGFDWDVEGNDTPASPHNAFSAACLHLMGRMSVLAKQHGYIMAMAPAESYLDPTTNAFSLSLRHNHEEWLQRAPGFNYRGRNPYAMLLACYGSTEVPWSSEPVRTFDFVTIQLYEGYSHANYAIRVLGVSPSAHLQSLLQALSEGWQVHFSSEPEVGLKDSRVSVPASQVVLGLANGWAGAADGKFLLLLPSEVREAHCALSERGMQPRGYAFWNIADEGRVPFGCASNAAGAEAGATISDSAAVERGGLFLARGLNAFLRVRPYAERAHHTI